MKQSWFASWFETIASTATGFILSLGLQYVVCWWYDLPLRIQDNLAIIALFTVASLLRGIAWRRLMEKLHVRTPLSPAMLAVIAERRRQIEVEGYSPDHDDHEYKNGELANNGAAYLLSAAGSPYLGERIWTWDHQWWKPDLARPRRDYVRGLALGIAGLEQLDRAKTKRRAS